MGDPDFDDAFDDDLDEALTQQVIVEELSDTEENSKTAESQLSELQLENKRLKDEICFLRSKIQSDQHVQSSLKATMESRLDTTSKKYQKDIEKLNFELEFKDHELSRIQASKSGESPKTSSVLDKRLFSESVGRKRTSDVLEIVKKNDTVSFDESDYRFYENKAPLLLANGEPVSLTEEEKQIRMTFFRTTFKLYKNPSLTFID